MSNGEHAYGWPRRTDFITGSGSCPPKHGACPSFRTHKSQGPAQEPANSRASHSRFNLIKNVQQDTMLRIQMKCQGKVGVLGVGKRRRG